MSTCIRAGTRYNRHDYRRREPRLDLNRDKLITKDATHCKRCGHSRPVKKERP